jgi:hypothetical protein
MGRHTIQIEVIPLQKGGKKQKEMRYSVKTNKIFQESPLNPNKDHREDENSQGKGMFAEHQSKWGLNWEIITMKEKITAGNLQQLLRPWEILDQSKAQKSWITGQHRAGRRKRKNHQKQRNKDRKKIFYYQRKEDLKKY